TGWLEKNVSPDDPTGRGVLAAAYANRGIVRDRQGAHESALADYIKALQVDEESVSGPGLGYKILYDPRPSTVRDRARYIYEQLKLPEKERLLRVPELDAESRMYKP
ncbi:MAG: tetratricopeptide repeat protein, partial [Alphaproteobacteria bacterium]|nr:tetratricopeptide repeat protein [Alphaproteobacteria bacterium]